VIAERIVSPWLWRWKPLFFGPFDVYLYGDGSKVIVLFARLFDKKFIRGFAID